MSSSARKSAFLGMPHGTAVGRLRKQILFMLLEKLDETTCFKCNLPIKTSEELSIEHKLPWEGRSVELFWDLSNIAFSHLKCNTPNKRFAGRIYPEGKSWCCTHKQFLSIDSFWKNKGRREGLMSMCKECYRERDKRINHAKRSPEIEILS